MNLGDFFNAIGAGLTATTGVPVWVSTLAPSVALLGVIVTQVVLLRNERFRARMEHSKIARDAGETLARELYAFRNEARGVRLSDIGDAYRELDKKWDAHAAAAYTSTMMIPSRTHREMLRTFVFVLNGGESMSGWGYGLSSNARGDFLVPTEAAYEVATAWLRHEQPTRRHRRLARKANRAIAQHNLWLQEMFEPDRKTGFVVKRWRKMRGRVRRWGQRVREPLAWVWDFLFAR